MGFFLLSFKKEVFFSGSDLWMFRGTSQLCCLPFFPACCPFARPPKSAAASQWSQIIFEMVFCPKNLFCILSILSHLKQGFLFFCFQKNLVFLIKFRSFLCLKYLVDSLQWSQSNFGNRINSYAHKYKFKFAIKRSGYFRNTF